jgi:hypothetical protein
VIFSVDCSVDSEYLQIFGLFTVFTYLCYFSPQLLQIIDSSLYKLYATFSVDFQSRFNKYLCCFHIKLADRCVLFILCKNRKQSFILILSVFITVYNTKALFPFIFMGFCSNVGLSGIFRTECLCRHKSS